MAIVYFNAALESTELVSKRGYTMI